MIKTPTDEVKQYAFMVANDLESPTFAQKQLIDCLTMYSECLDNERSYNTAEEESAAVNLFQRLNLYESMMQAIRCLAEDILKQMEDIKERAYIVDGCMDIRQQAPERRAGTQ